MNNEVIITCALTGSGDSALKSDTVPITPEEIAAAVHVRDPQTRLFSRNIDRYKKTARLIRASGVDVILNITAVMGADFVPDVTNPAVAAPEPT